MSERLYQRIVDQCKGRATRLNLFNYGEPFMHPHILDMVCYAERAGLPVHVSTNGHFFRTLPQASAVVRSGLSELTIAMDGATAASQAIYRIGSCYRSVLDGVARIVRARREMKVSRPRVVLQFLVMRHNIHERDMMVALARRLGVDALFAKSVTVIADTDAAFTRLAEKYVPLESEFSRYERRGGAIRVRHSIANACRVISNGLTITVTGRVTPCCYDVHERHVLGDCSRDGVAAIWNGAPMEAFRQSVRSGQGAIAMCARCPVAHRHGSWNHEITF